MDTNGLRGAALVAVGGTAMFSAELTGSKAAKLDEAMRVVDTLTDDERANLIRSCVQAALDYTRSGDPSHMTQHARNLLGTLRLRACPDYVEAIRRPPEPPLGEARRLDEVLAELERRG